MSEIDEGQDCEWNWTIDLITSVWCRTRSCVIAMPRWCVKSNWILGMESGSEHQVTSRTVSAPGKLRRRRMLMFIVISACQLFIMLLRCMHLVVCKVIQSHQDTVYRLDKCSQIRLVLFLYLRDEFTIKSTYVFGPPRRCVDVFRYVNNIFLSILINLSHVQLTHSTNSWDGVMISF